MAIKKGKLLYVMHVDWNWIKQRPHFIAERLNQHFDLTVLYKYKYRRKNLQKRTNKEVKLIPAFLFPKIEYIERYKFINDFLYCCIVKLIISILKPRWVYFTYPLSMNCIPKNYKGKIIYDCMDDYIEFIKDSKYKKRFEDMERRIIERSDLVFATSSHLKDVISQRYEVDKKIDIIRNAFDGSIIETFEAKNTTEKSLKIAYIGSISSWLDIELMKKSLADFEDVSYYLYGPVYDVAIPELERIQYCGVVEHSKLYETIKDADALIMPFKVNDIIESVDPVKIYEYINFNKNIISVFYNEISRYEDFCYFYRTYEEYIQILNTLLSARDNLKYSQAQRLSFLSRNTWDSRVNQITDMIRISDPIQEGREE